AKFVLALCSRQDNNKVGPLTDFDIKFEFYTGDTTGRVSRFLKLTVWMFELSVSGVSPISSLLRSLKLPKRKDISERVRGFSDAATVSSPKDHFVNDGFRFLHGCLRNLSTRRKDIRSYVGWHKRWCSRARLSPSLVPTYSTYSRECFRDTHVSIVSAVGFNLKSRCICRESTTGRAQVVIEALRRCDNSAKYKSVPEYAVMLGIAILAFETCVVKWRSPGCFDFLIVVIVKSRVTLMGPQMQLPPRGGTWVGNTCDISISKSKLYNASTTGRMAAYFDAFPKFNLI
ncbi:LOW QUALITY PROTEIN: hypothetical protein V1478_014922, partial [Vespula squamosa]